MGLTGLIFAAIAALWLVYLVPTFLQGRGDLSAAEEVPDLATSATEVTIVASGSSLASSEEMLVPVSTPLIRRAKLRRLGVVDQRAAARRRAVLMVLLLGQLVVAALVGFEVLLWWTALIPAALILAFLAVARVTVRAMRASLAAEAALIRLGDDEETIALVLDAEHSADYEHSVELSVPLNSLGSLWEPIPITRPTYVQQPLMPRTVRTIDLSAPVPAQPVVVEPMPETTTGEQTETRDVG